MCVIKYLKYTVLITCQKYKAIWPFNAFVFTGNQLTLSLRLSQYHELRGGGKLQTNKTEQGT